MGVKNSDNGWKFVQESAEPRLDRPKNSEQNASVPTVVHCPLAIWDNPVNNLLNRRISDYIPNWV